MLTGRGWCVALESRCVETEGPGTVWLLPFDGGTVHEGVLAALEKATHVLVSIPPEGGQDPVLAAYGAALARAP